MDVQDKQDGFQKVKTSIEPFQILTILCIHVQSVLFLRHFMRGQAAQFVVDERHQLCPRASARVAVGKRILRRVDIVRRVSLTAC